MNLQKRWDTTLGANAADILSGLSGTLSSTAAELIIDGTQAMFKFMENIFEKYEERLDTGICPCYIKTLSATAVNPINQGDLNFTAGQHILTYLDPCPAVGTKFERQELGYSIKDGNFPDLAKAFDVIIKYEVISENEFMGVN